jgi:HEAT repeat protein
MGKYTKVSARVGVELPQPGARPTDDQLDQLLALSLDEDPLVRRLALKCLCPCHVRRERTDVWERVFELAEDPDPGVRHDAIHSLTDGSPRDLAPRVHAALDRASTDPDRKVRRYVRDLRARQRRTGRVNVG